MNEYWKEVVQNRAVFSRRTGITKIAVKNGKALTIESTLSASTQLKAKTDSDIISFATGFYRR